MSGHPSQNYYGSDYRSQRQPAARNPYRASTGNAAGLYGAYGGGGGPAAAGAGASAAPVPSHYRDIPDDWSSTYYGDDSFTEDSVSEDFQRISLADARRHHGGGGGHQPPPHQHPQQHPQARYNSYAANVAAGRSGGAAPPPSHRGHAQSQREPSPTDSSYSQTTTSASTYAHRQHVQTAAAFHAHQRPPSKSLDRLSHYLPRGYRLAGPYGNGGGDEENMDPRFPEDDRSRGVMVPARSVPRTNSLRRPSSPEIGGRGREEFMGRHGRERRGPEYYSQSEKAAAYKRSMSQERSAQDRLAQERQEQERFAQERERITMEKIAAQERMMQERMAHEMPRQGRRESRAPAPGALLRRSSSIGRFESLSQADKTDTPTPPAGALVRRSKSVGPREAYRRRRSLGPINARIEQNFEEPGASTAVRLDLGGGQDVDISVNNRDKRRGPTIGSITINQRGSSRKARGRDRDRDGDSGERMLGAPSESARTRTTAAMTEREREYEEKMRRFRADISSSPPTSPELDVEQFSRMERKFSMGQRPRSASLGTALPRSRAKIPLQIAAPPTAGGAVGPVPPTPGGSEPRHTRISRKIVTRQALETLGYRYEDTGDTFTVYEILQPPQIDELMDMTARIRAARHDRRRARSRGERQFAEFGVDEYGSRKGPQKPLRPVITQDEKPFPYREPPTAGPPMPGAWPQVPPERRNNLPMPDHTRFQRPGPGNLGGPPGPPPMQQPAGSRFGRREGAAYYR